MCIASIRPYRHPSTKRAASRPDLEAPLITANRVARAVEDTVRWSRQRRWRVLMTVLLVLLIRHWLTDDDPPTADHVASTGAATSNASTSTAQWLPAQSSADAVAAGLPSSNTGSVRRSSAANSPAVRTAMAELVRIAARQGADDEQIVELLIDDADRHGIGGDDADLAKEVTHAIESGNCDWNSADDKMNNAHFETQRTYREWKAAIFSTN